MQRVQLRLYLEELQSFAAGDILQSTLKCAFCVISSPFPAVATRGRSLESARSMVVQLLTGVTADILATGQVQTEAVIPKGTKGKVAADLMDVPAATLHPETRHAEIRIKFANGTRKQPVYFQFHVQVNLRTPSGLQQVTLSRWVGWGDCCYHHFFFFFRARLNHSLPTHSEVTPPAISVTNEVQWEEAEGILVEKQAFQENSTCAWFALANVLQRHMIDATRQPVTSLSRIYGQVELTYFHHFLGGGAQVSVDAFREWWKWYGKAMHKVRYTKHILTLFLSGCLFGFIAKQDMELALRDQPPGTFMVRFSERNPGSFSIAYVLQSENDPTQSMVRHYLVSQEDITQRRSLADFLGESPALTHFLRYECSSGFNLAPTPLGPSVRYCREEKNSILQEYYAKREVLTVTSGYDRTLVSQPPQPVLLVDEDRERKRKVSNSGLAHPPAPPFLLDFGQCDEADYWDAE